jgi:eukaryotic-like serine/threonine-protein kinase
MSEINPIPSHDETARLAEVRRYAILDTPPDGAFDRVTRLAVGIFRVPIAIVSVVDYDRIWFKSKQGIDFNEIARDPGLCASAILQDEPYIVTDTAADPRALANPLVSGMAGLRFYAGSQLRTRRGYNLGMMCIIDHRPRNIDDREIAMLEELAGIVSDELEMRLEVRKALSLL